MFRYLPYVSLTLYSVTRMFTLHPYLSYTLYLVISMFRLQGYIIRILYSVISMFKNLSFKSAAPYIKLLACLDNSSILYALQFYGLRSFWETPWLSLKSVSRPSGLPSNIAWLLGISLLIIIFSFNHIYTFNLI